MKRVGKVVWGEGMFLTPHLFQQADRYHEHVLDFRLRSQTPFGWGVTERSQEKLGHTGDHGESAYPAGRRCRARDELPCVNL